MAEKLQNQLKEVGSKLENPPTSKDDLIKLLTQATESLAELDQSPPKALLESLQPLLTAIVKPELLKHQDKEVSLLVANCTCEITRITAPEAPYDDDVLKDIFRLFVSTFNGLKDTKDPSLGRRVAILDIVAKYRSFVVMLDLECDDLINEMFKTFFTVVSDEHPETIITSMETIMAVLLEESEVIGEDLLFTILSVLGRDKKDIRPAARRLAMNVIGQSADYLEPGIKQFLVSSMSGVNNPSNPQIDYHEVIYDIYRCAPQTLSKIVPHLKRELLTDKIDLRLKAVKLVGDLFSLKGSTIPQTFQPIFLEFLKKLTDKVIEVRMSALERAKLCLLSDPSRAEAPQLVSALSDRLLDDDETIRKQVVGVVSDVASIELYSISLDTIKLVAERLEDKSVLVKKYTMERLSDIYRTWCLKQIGGANVNHDYDWIPRRVLRSFFDKDFEQDTVERVLSTSLFPVEFSVKDKVTKWVKLFSNFDKVEVKALEKILEQKQRLQLEFLKYLSLRETYKDSDASELQKKTTSCVRFMSQCFVDPIKAESDFQILDRLEDDSIWKILTTLVDPNTNSLQSRSLRDELLKIVDEKHPLYELLRTLSMKCSYIIFDKDYVKDLLRETDQQKCDGNRSLTQSCLKILMILACFSPLLLSGIEEDLVHLLEDYDDEAIKEGVLHVVAKAGEMIREQLGESSSTLDLILERICLEGSRKQAKYAVHALAAITKDHGLKSLSFLYKRLVDLLEKRTDLPSVLQSLGCIAQTTMPIFETQETKIKEVIIKDILSCSQKKRDKAKESWDGRSELCSLKIFGIKTLVKSYLPVKDAHLRVGIDELIKDLKNILILGEISKDVESSSVDKAHLKLASAKAIIRLSKHWDKNIPVDLFHLTLRTSEVGFPEVRKVFLKKVHQYIKNRSLDPKYACAFLLDLRLQKPILEEENQNLSDILSMQNDGNSSVVHPVYILPYLVHAFAHHPSCPNIDECKDVKAYEPIYRKLYIYFSKLVDEDGKAGVGLKREVTISIISVLRNIKKSKDAVDTNMSKNSYAICDLCLSITKRLAQKHEDLHESVVPVSLPEMLYAPHTKKDENREEEKTEDGNREDKQIEVEKEENEKKEDENKEIENKEDEKKEIENKEVEKMEDSSKEIENKDDEKMEDENKDESKEDEKMEDAKIEDERKEIENKEVEKMEAENQEVEYKEDEKMEDENKEDEKKEIENKELEKMEDENKEDEKMEDEKIEGEKKEIENKEVEKMEYENKEVENKEDEKMEDENKEDEKIEDEKMEIENKEVKKMEEKNKEVENKEDEKMEVEKIEENKEVENKEDEKMEDENKDAENKEDENKEDDKTEIENKKDEKKEIENSEVEKTEDGKKGNESKDEKNKKIENKEVQNEEEVEKMEDENKEDEKKEIENKEDDKTEIEDKEVEKTEDEKKEIENREVEKTEDENKEVEKTEDGKKEIESKEEENKEEVEKMEDENKEIENKEVEKTEDEKNEIEKKEDENKEIEKIEVGNKEDEKIEIENKEDENIEIENKEVEKMEDENKENENKEDEKKEIQNKDEKMEDLNKEIENKEDEKKEIEKKEDEKKEDEKKEEAETEVIEGRTWLADESALAYFESLILEADGGVSSRINEDDVMKDSETDGNEVPLGKILKNLKAKGSKARKEEKNESTPSVETENNVDILGMLREINLDNMGISPKFDSSNGYGEIKNEATLKRKDLPNDLTNVSVPKRPRSSSSAKSHKSSSFMTGLKGGITFNDKMDDHESSGSEDKGLITDEVHLEKPKKRMEIDSNQKSGPVRKRKRRRVSRLVKCTSDKNEINNEDLVGRRIKVWWPLDKEFYGGVVKSYDDQKKKHVVLYDDGDIEVLYLAKERWKLVDNEHKLAERKLSSYSPPAQEGTSRKNIKSSGSSKQTKESTDISPSSMVRGKRTPRQNLKQGQKGVSQRSEYLEMGRSKDSDVSMPDAKSTMLPKIDNLNAGEVEDDSEKVEKSRSKENQMKDAESSSNGSISSHENEPGSKQKESKSADSTPCDESESDEKHNSDSGEDQEQSDESHSTDEETPNTKESNFNDFDNLEYSDDEPIGVWKSRVGKSVERNKV